MLFLGGLESSHGALKLSTTFGFTSSGRGEQLSALTIATFPVGPSRVSTVA